MELMMIPIAAGVWALMLIVVYFYVLIKMFKEEGFLKGILGFLCGLYLFLWGWIKHKEHKLTKVMALWSFLIFLPMAASAVMPGILAKMNFEEIAQKYGVTKPKEPVKKPKRGKVIKRKKVNKAGNVSPAQTKPVQVSEADQQKSLDFVNNARGLWKEDNLTHPDQALTMLNQAVTLDPNSPVAYNDRGKVHAKMGQFDRAIKDYDKAISLNEKYIKAYINRGVVLYETNQYPDALKDFNQAIVLKPDYANAYLNRGLVNYQMDRQDNACKDFTKACELGECEGSDWAKKNNICKDVKKK